MYDADDDGAVTFDDFMKAIESFAGIESEADKCRCKALMLSLRLQHSSSGVREQLCAPAGSLQHACADAKEPLLTARLQHMQLLSRHGSSVPPWLRASHFHSPACNADCGLPGASICLHERRQMCSSTAHPLT